MRSSSIRMSCLPSSGEETRPNSNFVSARMRPHSRAYSAASAARVISPAYTGLNEGCSLTIQSQCNPLNLRPQLGTANILHYDPRGIGEPCDRCIPRRSVKRTFIRVYILVVFPLLSLGGRCEDRVLKPLRFNQSRWHRYPVNSLALPILRPCRACYVMRLSQKVSRNDQPVMYPRTIASIFITSHFLTIMLRPSS